MINMEPAGKTIRVKDIMSTPFYSIRTNQTIQEALDLIKNKDQKRIAIVNAEGELWGFTDSWRLQLADSKVTIEKAITDKPHICTITYIVSQDKQITEIIPQLLDRDFLVVADDRGVKVGFITKTDLSRLSYVG